MVAVVLLYALDDLVHLGQFVFGALGHAAWGGQGQFCFFHVRKRGKKRRGGTLRTYQVPEGIEQRGQPDGDRDDLSEAPGRVVDVVRGEPAQVHAEDVEAVDVQPEEDEVERRGAEAEDRAGVGEEGFRGWDAELR